MEDDLEDFKPLRLTDDDDLPLIIGGPFVPSAAAPPMRTSASAPAPGADRAFGALIGLLQGLDGLAREAARGMLARRQALALHGLMTRPADPLKLLTRAEEAAGGAIAAAWGAADPTLAGLAREGVTNELLTVTWRRLRAPRAGDFSAGTLAIDHPPTGAFDDLIAAGRPRAGDGIVSVMTRLIDCAAEQPDLDVELPATFYDAGGGLTWRSAGVPPHNETIAAFLPFFLPGVDPLARAALVAPERPATLLPAGAWLSPCLQVPEGEGEGIGAALERGLRQEIARLVPVLEAAGCWNAAAGRRRRHSGLPRLAQLVAQRPVLTVAQAAAALGLTIRGARVLLDQARDERLLRGWDADGVRRYVAPAYVP